MNILWTRNGATVHEVRAALAGEKKPAYTTVLSVLQTLEKRKLVTHVPVPGSRMFRYSAVLSAHDARTKILQDVMLRLFAGSPGLLVRYLLETEGFTLNELRGIRDVLDNQERAAMGQSASAAVTSELASFSGR
jgi:predicted transcriptional regulator